MLKPPQPMAAARNTRLRGLDNFIPEVNARPVPERELSACSEADGHAGKTPFTDRHIVPVFRLTVLIIQPERHKAEVRKEGDAEARMGRQEERDFAVLAGLPCLPAELEG